MLSLPAPPAEPVPVSLPCAPSWPSPAVCSPLAPGASPWGNSPTSALPCLPWSPLWPGGDCAPALADSAPDSPPALAGGVLDALSAEVWLAEAELSAGWPGELELLEELLEELLDELLDGLLLLLGGGVGGVELGVEGVWGVVGVLALGQPASSRQVPAMTASCASE